MEVYFLEPNTQNLLLNHGPFDEGSLKELIVAADRAFEFEHWADAFALYTKVEKLMKVGGGGGGGADWVEWATRRWSSRDTSGSEGGGEVDGSGVEGGDGGGGGVSMKNGHVYYRVGVMYERGNYVKKDPLIALRYFQQAFKYLTLVCETDPEARCDLAYMLENGYGVSEDKAKAVEYYRIAAELGYPRAQVNLGYMYSNAHGVEADKAKAVMYYKMAADQGYTNAFTNLGYMYSNGYGIDQNKEMAVKYYRKAAKRGYARGLCNLGYMYDYGYGVSQSKSEAAKYYGMAASQGYSVAQCNLAYMYEHGHGVPLDKKKAVYYYQKAADQAYPRALCNLADMYMKGDKSIGIEIDKKKATQYYILAGDQDYDRAIISLEIILPSIVNINLDITKMAVDCLCEIWPSLTMNSNNFVSFKNPFIQSYLEHIFTGEGEFGVYRIKAVSVLMQEWPSKRALSMVNPLCKTAMMELCLVLYQLEIPRELYPFIMKQVIGAWQRHFIFKQE